MRLPIRNHTSAPVTLFIEPLCDQYEIPPGGEAIVTLDDGEPHSLDYHPENWVSLWNEGASEAVVEVVSKEQKVVVEALAFSHGWLQHYGRQGEAAAKDLAAAVDREEKATGYLLARFAAYRAFRDGFRAKEAEVRPHGAELPAWPGSERLSGAYAAGGTAAYFNRRTRLKPRLIELRQAPFDTDVALALFEEADSVVG